MNIIGRIEEQNKLNDILKSNKPEFLVVYGRRRIGKTFLIKEFFQNKFSFYATGELSKKSRGIKLMTITTFIIIINEFPNYSSSSSKAQSSKY